MPLTALPIESPSADPEVPAGATWRRIDFHLHTPGVDSFECPDGKDVNTKADRDQIAADFASRLATAGIEVAALTDYNGVREDWFQRIRKHAEQHEITVLPGAELVLREGQGVHILAIFPKDCDPRVINEELRKHHRLGGDLFSGDRGKVAKIESDKSLAETLLTIRQRLDCLLIPPHPGSGPGIVEVLGAQGAAQLITEVEFDALDHADAATIHKLRTCGVLSGDVLDTIACVEFSDAHRLGEIGAKPDSLGNPRRTWLKLSATDIPALRLALHDPATRLSLVQPAEPTQPRLVSFDVEGSGFLRDVFIRWNADLNTLIGGRGVGKSAILETLRYALDIPPYTEVGYRTGTVRHALGSGGEVRLRVERSGPTGPQCYEIRRILDEDPEVVDATTGRVVPIHPTETFGPGAEPMILLQQEVQAVARDDSFRLQLLDVLVGDAADQAARNVRRTQDDLRRNARDIGALRERLASREQQDERLNTVQHEIGFYEEQGVAEKFAAHTALRTDSTLLDRARESSIPEEPDWLTALATADEVTRRQSANLRAGTSSQKKLLDDAATALDTLADVLARMRREGQAAIDAARSAFGSVDSRWADGMRPLDEELTRLRRELDTDTLEPTKLLELVAERTSLEPLIEELGRVETELGSLRKDRSTLLRRLRDQRHEEHRLRRETCEAVNERLGQRLRLSVTFKGVRSDYRASLASLLKGSSTSGDTLDRLVSVASTDGAQLASAARAGAPRVEEVFGVSAKVAENIIAWLTADEQRLFELETLVPADNVAIELIVDGEPRSLEKLSMGQRATAMLLLLFALPRRTLILDQPEDDLDNRFVYEEVVALLRAEKGIGDPSRRRQVISATHNPNIPVLGDAEQVIALDADGGRARILTRASIDDTEVRDSIKTVLEGGEEAFKLRSEKYGGIE